jgi:exosortase family protein XrtF
MTHTENMITEFKPTLFFLGKFLILYFVGNLIYGVYVSSFRPQPDPLTNQVTNQTSWILNLLGYQNRTEDHLIKPSTFIEYQDKKILSVYEGCNGLNVMIIFVAFILSFGPLTKTTLWFIPLGLLTIHVSNLGRIIFLFLVTLEFPRALYITHKYLFTGIIYFIVFVLWLGWIKFYALRAKP